MIVLKKIIHTLAYIIYFLVGIYIIFLIPKIFGYNPLVVLSGSMEPNLHVGSIIYYKETKENDIKVGDVVTYKLGDKYVSHRIKSIDNGLYETKGDANNASDAKKIKYSEIIGKDLNFCIPFVGYYYSFVNNHLHIILIFVIVLIGEFINRNKEGEKENETDG